MVRKKRRGRGRPKLPVKDKRHRKSFRLPPDIAHYLSQHDNQTTIVVDAIAQSKAYKLFLSNRE